MAVRLEVTPPSQGPGRASLEGPGRASRGPANTEPLVYGFDQPRITIGRAASADVRLPSRTVSEAHAIIRLEDGAFAIVDQGSSNGTTHNGQAMVAGRRKLLRSGDQIDIAGYRIVFQEAVSIDSTTTPERTAGLARRIVREALGVLPATTSAPRVVVVAGPEAGSRLELPDPGCRLCVGRDDDCDLPLSDADVSRKHLELSRDWEGVTVRDLGSKNGITVNGRRLVERRLRDRDEIGLAQTVLAFEDAADVYLRELEGGKDDPVVAPVAPSTSEASPPSDALASSPDRGTPAAEPEAIPPMSQAAVAPVITAEKAPLRPPARRRGGGRSIADVVVFLLAAVVLVGSVAALVVLLRAG